MKVNTLNVEGGIVTLTPDPNGVQLQVENDYDDIFIDLNRRDIADLIALLEECL